MPTTGFQNHLRAGGSIFDARWPLLRRQLRYNPDILGSFGYTDMGHDGRDQFFVETLAPPARQFFTMGPRSPPVCPQPEKRFLARSSRMVGRPPIKQMLGPRMNTTAHAKTKEQAKMFVFIRVNSVHFVPNGFLVVAPRRRRGGSERLAKKPALLSDPALRLFLFFFSRRRSVSWRHQIQRGKLFQESTDGRRYGGWRRTVR